MLEMRGCLQLLPNRRLKTAGTRGGFPGRQKRRYRLADRPERGGQLGLHPARPLAFTSFALILVTKLPLAVPAGRGLERRR